MHEDDDSVPTLGSLSTVILDAPPSCVEWSRSTPEVCVVGTYSLNEPDGSSGGAQSRSGSLLTFGLAGTSLYGLSSACWGGDLWILQGESTVVVGVRCADQVTFLRL